MALEELYIEHPTIGRVEQVETSSARAEDILEDTLRVWPMEFYRIMMGPRSISIPSVGEVNAPHYMFGHSVPDKLLKPSPEAYVHPSNPDLTVSYSCGYSVLKYAAKNKTVRSDNVLSWTVNHERVRLGELKSDGASFRSISETAPRRLLAPCDEYFGPGDIAGELYPLALRMIRSKASYMGKDFKPRLPTHLAEFVNVASYILHFYTPFLK